MISFCVRGDGTVEWTNDSGKSWQGQEAVLPRDVLRAWWDLMIAVGMRQPQNGMPHKRGGEP